MNFGDANAQRSFRLSGKGQVLLHKCMNTIWCAMSGQGEGWSMRSVWVQEYSSKTATIGIALMQHITQKVFRCAHDKHENDTRIMLFQ